MLAARQAATAQLELFRAEMAAETAKMRAVVERQVPALHHTCCHNMEGTAPATQNTKHNSNLLCASALRFTFIFDSCAAVNLTSRTQHQHSMHSSTAHLFLEHAACKASRRYQTCIQGCPLNRCLSKSSMHGSRAHAEDLVPPCRTVHSKQK